MMTKEECAKLLVELYSDYFELSCKYGRPVIDNYAEAVSKAILMMAERKTDDN